MADYLRGSVRELIDIRKRGCTGGGDWQEERAREGYEKVKTAYGQQKYRRTAKGEIQMSEKDCTVEQLLQGYLERAAQGDPDGWFQCGVLYDCMEDIAEDAEKALYYYRKAAEQGHVTAQFSCGSMYYEGEGTAADYKEALYWYQKASDQGDAESQFKCGMMYEHGEGTAPDKEKALYWYEKAAAQGHREAIAVLESFK